MPNRKDLIRDLLSPGVGGYVSEGLSNCEIVKRVQKITEKFPDKDRLSISEIDELANYRRTLQENKRK